MSVQDVRLITRRNYLAQVGLGALASVCLFSACSQPVHSDQPGMPSEQAAGQASETPPNSPLLDSLLMYSYLVYEKNGKVVVTLPDALFGFGGAELSAYAQTQIQRLGEILTVSAPGKPIIVEGHTDAVGSEEKNKALSEQRAIHVARLLQQAGVPHHQLQVRGSGARYPVALNTHADGTDNPAGRAQNRRVEVIIMG